MSTRLALRIQERLEKLSPSERKLAQLLFDRQDDLLTYSATKLAELAGVSKATAARLFRSLGYSDFNEVRLQAREERNRTAPFRQSLTRSELVAPSRSTGAHLQLEIANLARTFESLAPETTAKAALLLREAPRVWFLGFGLEEGLARYGRLLFSRMRPDVQQLGLNIGAWAEELAMTGPRDAVILLSVRPRPRVLKPIVEYLRTTRAAIITITDARDALAAQRFSDVIIPCHASSHGIGLSHTSFMSALHLLALAYVTHGGDQASHRAGLIADIHEELDDHE